MSYTWSQIIEKLVTFSEDSKAALSEKMLTVNGTVNLCNVDECIDEVKDSNSYTVSSAPKHSLDDYSTLLSTDLSNVRTALSNKGVETSSSLKISEIPDKIREIPMIPELGKAKEIEKGVTSNYTSIVFTDRKAPPGTKVADWSKNNDKSVVKWVENKTLYVSSQQSGVKIIFPEDSGGMFTTTTARECTSIKFDNVDTSRVKSMKAMFLWNTKLKTLDLRNFDTSNVTDMSQMFQQCTQLRKPIVSSFDTRNVTNMASMFGICKYLEPLDLTNFNTSKVTDMQSMFADSTVSSLDLSSFDISNVTEMSYMFRACTAKTIYAKEWYYSKNSNLDSTGMFYNAHGLPEYTESKARDITMAKWTTNGGYFTKPT